MKWEYYILDIYSLKLPILKSNGRLPRLVDGLNDLGQQGWEYCGFIDGGDDKILFKRTTQ